MTFVTLPKTVDVPDRLSNAPFVPAYWMWSEYFTIKVIPERSIESEPITVYTHHGHDFSQPPLDIGTPSEQMDRTLEESRWYCGATITRWNTVSKDKSFWNVAIELVLQTGMFGHNDNPVTIEAQFRGLIENPSQLSWVSNVECHCDYWSCCFGSFEVPLERIVPPLDIEKSNSVTFPNIA
jgi:hypothetical protein